MIEPTDVYTPDEAAELLKLTRRAVITSGKRHGLCFVRGREVRFTGQQLLDLIDALAYRPNERQAQRYAGRIADDKLRRLALCRSRRPSAKRLLAAEFGDYHD